MLLNLKFKCLIKFFSCARNSPEFVALTFWVRFFKHLMATLHLLLTYYLDAEVFMDLRLQRS